MPQPIDIDQDAIVACTALVGRSGAKQFECGYLYDDVPFDEAGWYAQAIFRGVRLIEENHRGPQEACDALARRILTGATCRRCGKLVVLSDGREGCRWRRMGQKWEPGCGLPIDRSIPAPLTGKGPS
jgi:hypothetical protein